MDSSGTALKPNILIAPLDWGLGHATRSVPIIQQLLRKNCKVIIAADGAVEALLQQEFPDLQFITLKGYQINYSKNSWSLPFIIGKQIPKILSAIQYENDFLDEIVKEYSIHGIISDNRYGFYHEEIPSIFITHQLLIKTPFGKLADNYLQRLNYEYINSFSECWVPDNESSLNLAGELSHPETKPSIPVKYVGPLSRFKKANEKAEQHLLILLSGPEPQRTIFENLIIDQLSSYNSPVVLVRGLPSKGNALHPSSNITVHNHLPAAELGQKINEASLVISRCGYSTVMDLAILQKQSILVPTPGQTEQEYLSKQLMKNNFALCIPQQKFKLTNALELAASFNYRLEYFPTEHSLEPAIDNFISQLKTSTV
jgi:uncharacterized protein (TIGR00661 family)